MTTKKQILIQLELAECHYREAVDRHSWDVARSYAEVMVNYTGRLHLMQRRDAEHLRKTLTGVN